MRSGFGPSLSAGTSNASLPLAQQAAKHGKRQQKFLEVLNQTAAHKTDEDQQAPISV
jgi:hypothetical protein